MREKPSGLVRLTAAHHAAETVVSPVIFKLLPQYPDLKIELSVDSALTDIVGDRFDAGVRLGEQIDKDMIAVRIGPDLRMAVVAAPSYFAERSAPVTPHDLTDHVCINLRFPSAGGLYPWEFSKAGRDVNVRVDGQFVVNNMRANLKAAEAGVGLAIVMEDQCLAAAEAGRLVRVLEDWCEPFTGYHIYYPSRRQVSPAFEVLVEALRYRG